MPDRKLKSNNTQIGKTIVDLTESDCENELITLNQMVENMKQVKSDTTYEYCRYGHQEEKTYFWKYILKCILEHKIINKNNFS